MDSRLAVRQLKEIERLVVEFGVGLLILEGFFVGFMIHPF